MQRAIVIQGPGRAAVTSIPIPDVYQDFLKIRTQAVALNPSDWKHVDWRADKGAIVGIDYAGYVEEVGPLVRRRFNVGDRVAGFTHGCQYLQILERRLKLTMFNASKYNESFDWRLCRPYPGQGRGCLAHPSLSHLRKGSFTWGRPRDGGPQSL